MIRLYIYANHDNEKPYTTWTMGEGEMAWTVGPYMGPVGDERFPFITRLRLVNEPDTTKRIGQESSMCSHCRAPAAVPCKPDCRLRHMSTRPGRDWLGSIVREEWVRWAREQPNPKPSWLTHWNELNESDREVDRRIGETLFQMGKDSRPQSTLETIETSRERMVYCLNEIDRHLARLRAAIPLYLRPDTMGAMQAIEIEEQSLRDYVRIGLRTAHMGEPGRCQRCGEVLATEDIEGCTSTSCLLRSDP